MPNQSSQLWQQAGIGLAGNAVSSLLGIALGGINANQQEIQNRRLMNVQKGMQMEITDHNMQKQLELWKATNFPEQMKQIKEAGLNPAMLYGMGGAGGATSSLAQGNISGAQAAPNYAPQANEFGIQLQLLQAQKANIEADTKLKEATAQKTSGVDTGEAQSRIDLNKLTAEYLTGTMEDRIKQIKTELEKTTAETNIAENMFYVYANTANAKIKTAIEQATGATLQNALLKDQDRETISKIKVNEATIQKIGQEILQGWKELDIKDKQMRVEAVMKKFDIANMHIFGLKIPMTSPFEIAKYINKLLGIE